MANEVGLEFQRNIFNYVRKEFKFSKLGNLRRDFEQLAFPARLHSEYSDFLEFSAEYDTELVRDDLSEYCEEDTDVAIAFVRALDETSKKKGKFINNPICAKFSNHYNIRGLFPPTLMEDSEIRKPFIPIDFRTKPSETKILMAGLHSGCKTFYLDNLVAASIIGQTGESLIAESLTVPKYNRIFYYKSTDSGNGGKCETELIQVNSIISRAQKGDLLVIDEFLDSAQAEIANTIGPAILDRLLGSKATVIVTSHRCTDYDSLAEKGWTIMTPDYEIREERVIPLKRLVRGLPNQKVNMQYIQGRFNDIFN